MTRKHTQELHLSGLGSTSNASHAELCVQLDCKMSHLCISFAREQHATKVAQWWAMPHSVVLAIGMDHGTVKPPEPLQRRAIQWLLLSVLLRPGTPNAGDWKDLLASCMLQRGKLGEESIARLKR